MVTITALWLPILLAAVIVFIASAIMHMVLTYHRSDYRKIPDEANVMSALRTANVQRGMYMFPHCDHKEMNTPEAQAKFKQGPVGIVTIMPTGLPNMGRYLGLWFGYCLLVSVMVAYLTGRTVSSGAEYLHVFRVAGTAAFMAYGLGLLSNAIWKNIPWSVTIKEVVDGLIYAILVAGVFGWLWPR
jgi:hypothetical protein